jgi:hypothetical protein
VKAEVFVSKTHTWWTLLAIAGGLAEGFDEVSFVKLLGRMADVVIIDAALIDEAIDRVHSRSLALVILWDGYQSYRKYEKAIEKLAKHVAKVEIRSVGDPSEWDAKCEPRGCKVLFSQSKSAYDQDILSAERMKVISFPGTLTRYFVVNRSTLISCKVLTQMIIGGRFFDYMHTKFVFCGQSGLGTLHRYAEEYGIPPIECVHEMGGVRCDESFFVRWIGAVLRNKASWSNRIVSRALLRLIALRALFKAREDEIFLNLYPARNINAYQAGLLFKHHAFLEFGGLNGEEAIYPRTADLAFHARRVIRFERIDAIRHMHGLDGEGSPAISQFIAGYERYVLSKLESETSRNDLA